MSTVKPENPIANAPRVAFIGGGSGGHLFPAVAVCHALLRKNPSTRFLFLTSHRTVDQQVLKSSGLPPGCFELLPYASMPGQHSRLSQILRAPEVFRSFWLARKALLRFQPQVVIGVGASASVAGVIAANQLRIPVALMEQNTVPGKATQLLARRAKITLAGLPFQDSAAGHWHSPLTVTGTPVRTLISDLAAQPERTSNGRSRLLILGGSQGSASVNKLVLAALADEHCVPSDWQIIHQTGEAQVTQVTAEYARRGRTATVLSFLPNLPELLATATVVISRAGAGTLQELACAGLPAILIPFSRAASNHQLENARYFASRGAAALIEETDEDAGLQLRHHLNEFAEDPALLTRYQSAIRQLAKPDAANVSAEIIAQLVSSTSGSSST